MTRRRLIKGLTRIGHLYCCIWQRTQRAAIQANEALADQVFAAQQADKDAIAKKAAERAAAEARSRLEVASGASPQAAKTPDERLVPTLAFASGSLSDRLLTPRGPAGGIAI